MGRFLFSVPPEALKSVLVSQQHRRAEGGVFFSKDSQWSLLNAIGAEN